MIDEVWEQLMNVGTLLIEDSPKTRPIIGKLRKRAERYGYKLHVGFDKVAKVYILTLNPPEFKLPEIKLPGFW